MPDNVILDSCIFVEAWSESEFTEQCQKYINDHIKDTTKKGACPIPILVPGEVIKTILEKNSGDKDRIIEMLKEYKRIFLEYNLMFIPIDRKVLEIMPRLEELRVNEHDKLIVASAIVAGCAEIITLDIGLSAENQRISRISMEINGMRLKITNPNFDRSRQKVEKRKFKRKR